MGEFLILDWMFKVGLKSKISYRSAVLMINALTLTPDCDNYSACFSNFSLAFSIVIFGALALLESLLSHCSQSNQPTK